ncbi:MAG: DUF368 domain-containing protein [Bacilli bacterium]|jgi:putative membrane protein
MNFIKQIIIGIVIGGGMILPGVSGGVLAVVFGVYEPMLEAVLHFFKSVRKNIIFLVPLIMGTVIGVLLFGKVLFFVFDNYPMEAKYVFIGLILGGLPVLFKEAKLKGHKKINIVALTISLVIAVALFVLGKNVLNINLSSYISNNTFSFLLLFITGVIFIAGKVIPGISSSFMLMLIGMYQFILNILNNPFNLTTNQYLQLIPFTLGMIIGAISLMQLVEHLIKEHYSATYSIIIGFVIGSITAIYPGFSFDISSFISLLLLAVSFALAYMINLTGQK